MWVIRGRFGWWGRSFKIRLGGGETEEESVGFWCNWKGWNMNSGFEEEFERRWNWDWDRHGVGYWVDLESTWGRVLGGVGSNMESGMGGRDSRESRM